MNIITTPKNEQFRAYDLILEITSKEEQQELVNLIAILVKTTVQDDIKNLAISILHKINTSQK